jgi:hypothetical protein
VAALEAQFKTLDEDHRELYRFVHGPPREESIRGRLHILESDTVAAKAAHAALEAAQMLRQTQQVQQFTRVEKLVGLSFAAVVAATTVINLILAVIHHT